METKIRQTQADLVKAIAEIATTMPLARTVQLYPFALFLKTHPLPTEETFAPTPLYPPSPIAALGGGREGHMR